MDLLPNNKAIKVIKVQSRPSDFISFKKIEFPAEKIITKIRRAINGATEEVARALKEALDEAILSEVWQWTEGVRDIYDTGELMESGTVTVDGTGIKIAYSAPYAMLVHYGGYINPYGISSAKVYLPPRPWIEATLNGDGPVPKFDYIRFYRQAIEVEFA